MLENGMKDATKSKDLSLSDYLGKKFKEKGVSLGEGSGRRSSKNATIPLKEYMRDKGVLEHYQTVWKAINRDEPPKSSTVETLFAPLLGIEDLNEIFLIMLLAWKAGLGDKYGEKCQVLVEYWMDNVIDGLTPEG